MEGDIKVHNCLNCGTELQGKFCVTCGQKAAVHRITFRKFIEHDIIHGIFHIDRGIIYTVKSLLISPGYTAKKYIEGKRVKHYNIFALFLIIITLKVLVDKSIGHDFVFRSYTDKVGNIKANNVIDSYYKLMYLMSIPVLSLLSLPFFKRLKYNYAEHIVMNCFLVTGCFMYSIFFGLLNSIWDNQYISLAGYIVFLSYFVIGLWQVSKPNYKGLGFSWRVFLIMLCFGLVLFIGLGIFISIFFGGNFQGTMGFRKF